MLAGVESGSPAELKGQGDPVPVPCVVTLSHCVCAVRSWKGDSVMAPTCGISFPLSLWWPPQELGLQGLQASPHQRGTEPLNHVVGGCPSPGWPPALSLPLGRGKLQSNERDHVPVGHQLPPSSDPAWSPLCN